MPSKEKLSESILSGLSTQKRLFVNKAARSIVEIQPNVNNITDIVIFLEVLGYDSHTVNENGFKSPYELAKYIHDIIDFYHLTYHDQGAGEEMLNLFSSPIPSTVRRLFEALVHMSPFLGSLIILYITGLSLWMTEKLPADVTIAFVAGVFVGLIFSEGPLQLFSRLFYFYYDQTNVGEVRRILRRDYVVVGLLLTMILTVVYVIAIVEDIPYQLINITVISIVMVSLHRTSFMILYSLRKLVHIVLSYGLAFVALLSVYFITPEFVLSDIIAKYFTALGVSFAVLSVFAIYHHLKIVSKHSFSNESGKSIPHFYKTMTATDVTIRSRFSVQFWDNIPYFLSGIFFLIILFGDRVISWIFNPETVISINGTVLPMAFNPTYHIGADLALFIMIPTMIIQYVIVSPIHSLTNNLVIKLKVSETKKVDKFLQYVYKKLVILSLIISLTTAGILNILGPQIISYLGGSEISIQILNYASMGNILLSIFTANNIFIIYLNRAKALVMISGAAALFLGVAGVIAGHAGYQNIVIAYLLSNMIAATVSTLYTIRIMRKSGSNSLARYA